MRRREHATTKKLSPKKTLLHNDKWRVNMALSKNIIIVLFFDKEIEETNKEKRSLTRKWWDIGIKAMVV